MPPSALPAMIYIARDVSVVDASAIDLTEGCISSRPRLCSSIVAQHNHTSPEIRFAIRGKTAHDLHARADFLDVVQEILSRRHKHVRRVANR